MKGSVLVVDDDRDSRDLLCAVLAAYHQHAEAVDGGSAALAKLDEGGFDVVITDVRMNGMSGIELCRQIRAMHPDVPVIVVTGQADVETAVAALRAGAWDFVTKALDADHVAAASSRAVEHRLTRSEVHRLKQVLATKRPIQGIIGNSPSIDAVTDLVTRFASGDATVLITGESGTGKELVARALHSLGARKAEPFVAVNCGAVPANLLESELFGHIKGAFTDAHFDRPGLFIHAGTGTAFLDEIGEMPLDTQVKLLRVLQERSLRPVGGDEERPFAARVVCATNRDLATEVAEGRFRKDLYYRINVVTIDVPPLRDRGSDVLLLAENFLRRIAERKGKSVTKITAGAMRKLVDYDWPGNVRELENSLERAVALASTTELETADLPAKIRDHQRTRMVIEGDDPSELLTMSEMERLYVRRVLAACDGNKTRAARILGIDRRSLYRRLDVISSNEVARG